MSSYTKQYKDKIRERGVAANVIMAVDVDGKRGVISLDGTTAIWGSTFEQCWRIYLAKESKKAEDNAKATPYDEEPEVVS